jgi:hypothetical protein
MQTAKDAKNAKQKNRPATDSWTSNNTSLKNAPILIQFLAFFASWRFNLRVLCVLAN